MSVPYNRPEPNARPPIPKTEGQASQLERYQVCLESLTPPFKPPRARCLSPFSNGRADDKFLFLPGHPKCFRTLLVYRS
jgi:hypothetical protein